MNSLIDSDGRFYDVNFFEYEPVGIVDFSLPSSAIFYEAGSLLPLGGRVFDFACQVRKHHGVNRSLWGVRNECGKYSVEFYFYYPKKYSKNTLSSVVEMSSPFISVHDELACVEDEESFYLTSVNFNGNLVSDLNVYKSIFDSRSDIFCFFDKGFSIDRISPRFSSYSAFNVGDEIKKKNDYWGYFDGNVLHRVLKKVYELAASKYPGEEPLKAYDFLRVSCSYSRQAVFDNVLVADKGGAIGLYFLHLDIGSFINFLSCHQYDSAFVDVIKKKKKQFSHLLFDVGIDFYLHEGEFHIKKTAFWGSL